jgi:hypothetical protein
MKKIDIGEMKTFAQIDTNLPKLQYGSGKRGAGFLDTYSTLKTVRGKFVQYSGSRALAGGDVVPVTKYKFITRYDVEVSNAVDKQMRMIINGAIYTVDNCKPDTDGKAMYLIFDLMQFGK